MFSVYRSPRKANYARLLITATDLSQLKYMYFNIFNNQCFGYIFVCLHIVITVYFSILQKYATFEGNDGF